MGHSLSPILLTQCSLPFVSYIGLCQLQVPVYVWAPEEEGQFQPGRCSRWWLHQSLQALEKDFAALGTSMVYRRSPESRTALIQLVEETGAQASNSPHFLHAWEPYSSLCRFLNCKFLGDPSSWLHCSLYKQALSTEFVCARTTRRCSSITCTIPSPWCATMR